MITNGTAALQVDVSSSLVLHARPIRAETDHESLSRFSDDRWDLTPGIIEEHSAKTGINFTSFPPKWRSVVKEYFWHVINTVPSRGMFRGTGVSKPSLRTVSLIAPHLRRALTWFDSQGIGNLREATPEILDRLLGDLSSAPLTFDQKRMIIVELRRLWCYRDVVPAHLQLPTSHPWFDDRISDLLVAPTSPSENRTPRVPDATLVPLFSWALRFAEEFSDDIIRAYRDYQTLVIHNQSHRPRGMPYPSAKSDRQALLIDVARRLEAAGLGWPGRELPNGSREIVWAHVQRLTAGGPGHLFARHDRTFIDSLGLPVDDDKYLLTEVRGKLDGQPWLPAGRVSWDSVVPLADQLQTACFIVLAYLSGMRPGEVLSLERGCLRYNDVTQLWEIYGRHWKGVRGPSGEKLPEGVVRKEPWTVHPAAAQAVQALERLHDEQLLFPADLRTAPVRGRRPRPKRRPGKAKTSSQVGTDIRQFIEFVNAYCNANERTDLIAHDLSDRISPSRFRRTLAWHIVRNPRGLVAAAIQYGHVGTHITQGYGGSYASGFPDDIAMERWLEKLDRIVDLQAYVDGGGVVSGPSAQELKRRVTKAVAKFAGRTIPTARQAERQLADPDMQIHRGLGMHCVFDRTKALCLKDVNADSDTPQIGNCRSNCGSIARTDSDVAELQATAASLLDDPLAPSVRYERAIEVARLSAVVAEQHADGQSRDL